MKKIISALLAVLMLTGALSVAASAQTFVNDETYVVGNVDASSDKEVNALDVYAIRSYLVGESVNIDRQAADMDANDKIDAVDVYNLRCLLVGLKTGSDFDNGKQVYKFTIGGVDISEFKIYVHDGAEWNDNSQYAAELFQRYTRISCGVSPEIVKGTYESGHAVIFNLVDRKSELGQKLGAEGYQYDVTDGNLNVYGTYRGNMYAVYEILENYLGLRFYDNEYTFQYKTRVVDIPDGTDQFVIPKMKFRYCGQNVTDSGENYYLPARQNGTQINGFAEARFGLLYGPQFINAHSYGYYWQISIGTMPADDGSMTLEERYRAKYEDGKRKFEEDPTLKSEYSWQPCATDSSSYNTLFEGMLLTLKRIENWGNAGYAFTTTAKDLVADGQKSMSFSLCDNEQYCKCRLCGRKANGVINIKGEVVVPKEGYGALYLDMANKAAVDIQQYYPGMRIHCILYNHDIPATIRPNKNVIVFYCGQGCNNHYINSGECTNLGQLGKENNIKTAESLKAWGSFCAETGAEMWYWYYGVTYHYYMVSMPSVYNIYYDYKFMYEECNVRGIYYEGGGPNYNYETLKSYLSTRMEWEPDMSFEKFIEYMKEYLYMYYGAGYEEMYQFIDMENTAGNECGTCFVSNFDRPGDMYSYAYIDEHYEEMRELLTTALDKAEREEQKDRIRVMIICFDFLGLSSSYDRMYTNGDAASRALYEQRYTDMYNGLVSREMRIFSDPYTYTLPEKIDFTVNPMTQFYENGSRRPGVKP